MRTLIAVAAALLATPAHAGFETGNDLHDWCSSARGGPCMGYVAGVADTAEFLQPNYFCAPTGVELGQMVDVVSSYLVSYPEKRHFPAQGIVMVALAEAFPCQ